MIELMAGLPENVLGLSAKGEVTGEDYEQILIPAVEERTRRRGKIRLLYHLGPAFTGYTASALWTTQSWASRICSTSREWRS